jgi:hypothetical protein
MGNLQNVPHLDWANAPTGCQLVDKPYCLQLLLGRSATTRRNRALSFVRQHQTRPLLYIPVVLAHSTSAIANGTNQ